MQYIKNLLSRIWNGIAQHKIIAIILFTIILSGVYYGYGKLNGGSIQTKYILANVQKGTLISSVSGTGQVLASNQINIQPQVSGRVVYIGVQNGQRVKAGTLLIELDTTDAEKAVRNAQNSLDNAKLNLEKLKQSSADPELIKENAFSSISNTFLDLPNIMVGANTIINGSTLSISQSNVGTYHDFVDARDVDTVSLFISSASNDFAVAQNNYNTALMAFKNTSIYADSTTTINLLNKTIDTTKAVSQALKSEQNLLDYLNDYAANHTGQGSKILPPLVGTYRNNLQTYINLNNNHISDLINIQNTIKNAPLDVRSQELSLQQQKNNLLDAQQNLSNYYIRAPFDGVVAKINVVVGDNTSSNVVTFVSSKNMAGISLNEVDVAKIKIGQKSTITFDAIPNLTVTGNVAQIDTIGTVTQGVVTYSVQIAFDIQDERIKSGMSVSAAIITNTKQNILLVPNAAVKTRGNTSYVQMPSSAESLTPDNSGGNTGVILKFAPLEQSVEIGLSNDSTTEITSGLKEGDLVIVRTLSSTATTPIQSSSSFRIPGVTGGGGGGAIRATGGGGGGARGD